MEQLPPPWRASFEARVGAEFGSKLSLGARLYAGGYPWHAHEVLEELWQESSGDDRPFLQGLIQLCAARHHAMSQNRHGALTLLKRSERNIKKVSPQHRGVDLVPIADFFDRVREDPNRAVDASNFPRWMTVAP